MEVMKLIKQSLAISILIGTAAVFAANNNASSSSQTFKTNKPKNCSLKLISSEGKELSISKDVAMQSKYLSNLLNNFQKTTSNLTVPLPIDSSTLNIIVTLITKKKNYQKPVEYLKNIFSETNWRNLLTANDYLNLNTDIDNIIASAAEEYLTSNASTKIYPQLFDAAYLFSPAFRRNCLESINRAVVQLIGYQRKQVYKPKNIRRASFSFSPNGSKLAITDINDDNQNIIKIIEAQSGNTLHEFSDWNGSGIESRSFSPDGSKIVIGQPDNTLNIYCMRDGSLLTTLTGPKSWIKSANFMHDEIIVSEGQSTRHSRHGEVHAWMLTEAKWKKLPMKSAGPLLNKSIELKYDSDGAVQNINGSHSAGIYTHKHVIIIRNGYFDIFKNIKNCKSELPIFRMLYKTIPSWKNKKPHIIESNTDKEVYDSLPEAFKISSLFVNNQSSALNAAHTDNNNNPSSSLPTAFPDNYLLSASSYNSSNPDTSSSESDKTSSDYKESNDANFSNDKDSPEITNG